MPPEDTSVAEAGRRIVQSGAVDDVRRGRTNRELARGDDAGDADDSREEDRRPARREREERDADRPKYRRKDEADEDPDDRESEDRDEDEADEDEDADTSNREDGEDGDEDDLEDDDADAEDERNRKERMFKVKVNGETLEVPESELVAGYSRGRDYHQKTQALAERGRQFQAGHAQVAKDYHTRLQMVNGVLTQVMNDLVGSMDGPEMRELRAKDQTAWLAAREDYNDRVNKVREYISGLNQEQERHRNAFTEQSTTLQAGLVAQETEQVVKYIPDFLEGKDGKPSGARRLFDYLAKNGFQEAEIMSASDHRYLVTAEKARRYDEMMAKRKDMPKPKPKAMPKRVANGRSEVTSGTTRKDREDRSEFRRATDRLKKTGDMRDGGDAINAYLNREAKRNARRTRGR
jgi:hypothetical protein